MNKLLATLVAGTFAVASTAALAQGTTPTAEEKMKMEADKAKSSLKAAQSTDKAKAFSEKEKALQDASRNSPNPLDQKTAVEKSKMDPKMKSKYDEKAAQDLSKSDMSSSQQKANVAASKAQGPREKMPNIKNLTKEQRAELLRQLQQESTGQ
jgi:hypothetical protein